MRGPDLRPLYEAATNRTRTCLVYGEACSGDAADARRLAGVPGVRLEPVADWAGHDAQVRLIEQDRFGALLAEALGPAPP